jgi:hypothetical protein
MVIQDKAILIELLLVVLEVVEQRLTDAESLVEKVWWVQVGTYMTICFVLSLRGPEGFMLDLHGLRKYLLKGHDDPDCPFVVVPLLGRFKGKEHHRQHLLMAVAVMNSGLMSRKWLDALVILQEYQGRGGARSGNL